MTKLSKDINKNNVENIDAEVLWDEQSEKMFKMLQMSITSMTDNWPKLTESQVDSIISQREKAMDYIHEDNKNDSWDRKFVIVCFASVFLIVFFWVLFKYPEYIWEIVSLFIWAMWWYWLGKTNK
jgi:hypothetical protein